MSYTLESPNNSTQTDIISHTNGSYLKMATKIR